MMTIKTMLLAALVGVSLIQAQSTCSAYCDISFDGGGYALGCTDETQTGCTRCYSQLYQLSGTTCILRTQNNFIYNISTQVTFTTWTQNPAINVDTGTYSTKTYFRFRGAATASINYTIPSTNAHYGIRFRFWVYHQSPNNNQMYFSINRTLQQTSLGRNLPEDSSNTWIITTDHLSYTENVVTLTLQRTDGFGITYYAGIDDLLVIVAECVVGCASCTSLNDCQECVAGYYLNNQTHLCVTDCGPGMYRSGTMCQLCYRRCQTCNYYSTYCQSCVDKEPNEAFLYGSYCYDPCPYNYNENYTTHRCECGAGYYTSFSNCYACHAHCLTCFSGDQNSCYNCSEGYYLQYGTNTCSLYCPTGQYYRQGVQIQECYQCDASCFTCQNSSTVCTSCLFATNDKYLHDHQCLSLCPDGYEQNNNTFVCDACPAETFSYEQVCYSECPQYYSESEERKACILLEHRGYPLNLILKAADTTTISFSTTFDLGISATNKTQLETDFQNKVALTFIRQENTVQVIVGATTSSLTIDSLTITNNVLTLNSSAFEPTKLTALDFFKVQFSDNIYSPDNVMYTISTSYSFSDNPSDLHSLFESNIASLRFTILPMIIIALLFLLVRAKYSFSAWLEYLHCIQLLGLALYSIFPHSVDLSLYSFMVGVDYANFSYIYNVPLNLMTPCTDCVSLSGHIFIQDDMDYLRTMGSVLELFIGTCLIALLLMNWQFTRQYAFFLLRLVVMLVIIKSLHSWFCSLIGNGLNSFTYYIIATNVMGLVMLIIFIFHEYKWKQEYGSINVRTVGLFGYTLLIAFIPLAPTLLSFLIITWSLLEWLFIHVFQVDEYGVPLTYAPSQTQEASQNRDTPCEELYHRELLRSFKPLTAFLIVSVVMISYSLTSIVLIACVVGIQLLLLLVDFALLCRLYHKVHPVSNQADQTNENLQFPKNEDVIVNFEKSLGEQEIEKEEGKSEERASAVVVVEDVTEDDEVVQRKFRKKKSQLRDFSFNE